MGGLRVDPDKFEIKHIITPAVQDGLASTVVIEDTHYINIGFNFALVQRAGRILPRGISQFFPAFMSLRFDIASQTYKMYVQYAERGRQGERFLLLVFKERPRWLRFMKPLPGRVQPQQRKMRTKNDKNNQAQSA